MLTEEINQDMFFTVLGVNTWDWIPILHSYGPLKKCTIKVKDIINLLNNDIDVQLREDQNEKLYLFLKKYHIYLDNIGSNLPKAINAEEILYKRVYKTAYAKDWVEQISNPLELDPREDNFDDLADNILSVKKDNSVGSIKGMEIKQKFKKPRGYEIVGGGINVFENLTSSELNSYAEIDFNIDNL